ncbi:hypothetical protein ACQ7B2_32050, partial [Escherichia coli]
MTVNVPAFTPGTTAPVVVTGTLIDPNIEGFFQVETVDVAGNVGTCERVVPAVSPRIIFRTSRNGNMEIYS